MPQGKEDGGGGTSVEMAAEAAKSEAGLIALLCAMESELAHLRAALPPAREEWQAGRRVWLTALEGQPIILGVCGIGMVSAAAVTESLIGLYAPAAVLNCGCAGAHRQDLLPGDLVIGARVVAYDNIHENPDGSTRYAGMSYLHRGTRREIEWLSASPSLLEAALRVAAAAEGQHEPWPVGVGWPDGVPHRPPRLVVGTIASADRWNRAPATIESLVARHDSLCEDMEAAAIGLTCASHDVPFLTVKDIVNNELLQSTPSGSELADQVGKEQLGRRAASLALAILRELVR